MLAQKGMQRPCGNFKRQGCHVRRWHRERVVVQARERSGPSGIHIDGNSPTSPKGWEIMRQKLTDAGVKVLSPQEVIFARDKGTVIVDVRPEGDYDEGHVPGAANVPFYQPITGWSPFKVARRVGYAMFGVLNGTEVNPEFASSVRELVSGSQKGVILYCSQGGVLESNENYKRGWQTRSLVAAYDLLQEGLTNVSIMKGGFTEWVNSGREIEVMVLVEEEEGETAETAEQAETAKVQRN
eukprot:GHUV01004440.1.p1 GENE.GHUV01004440.1~~GHUV01004440.1.p1  ORF type:complete len:240 (+),score=40.67 GHUV01004440.1:160-879(+)